MQPWVQMNPVSTPEFLTAKEAADVCRCSVPTIRRRIAEGQLPAVQLGGRGAGVRIRRDDLENWLFGNGD